MINITLLLLFKFFTIFLVSTLAYWPSFIVFVTRKKEEFSKGGRKSVIKNEKHLFNRFLNYTVNLKKTRLLFLLVFWKRCTKKIFALFIFLHKFQIIIYANYFKQ